MFQGTPDPLPLVSTLSDFGEQHQVLGSYYFRFGSICTSILHMTLFSEVGRRRFERSRTWNALEIASISVSVSKLLVLPVCTCWCSPESYGVDAGGSGLGVPENIAAAAEITLISFSVAKL